jgi:hypothetical protein
MADLTPHYERLTRSHLGLNGYGSLWLGPDHLLLVTSAFGVESYRRWYFRDVQAFIARHTARRLVVNLVVGMGALAFVAGAGAAFAGAYGAGAANDRTALLVLGSISAVGALFFLALTMWNTLLGPGCTVQLQTPLGVERLKAPTRLRTFERVAARLQPQLEASQA